MFGNSITTEIGKFSAHGSPRKGSKVGDSSTKSKESNLSGGTGEPNGESKKSEKRHKISFADEISGDKSKLTDIHLIESYKKFN